LQASTPSTTPPSPGRSEVVYHAAGVPERFRVPIVTDPDDAWNRKRAELWGMVGTGKGAIVLIHGPRGRGKTQMVCDVCHFVRNGLGGRKPVNTRYTTAMDLFRDIRGAFNSDTRELDLIQRYATPALLVIDEAHERGQTDFEGRVLTEIVDKRYSAMRETFIVTNETPEQAQKSLGPSIWSRMTQTGGLVEVNWVNYRAGGGK
jgi:DNA replication protein DnaC